MNDNKVLKCNTENCAGQPVAHVSFPGNDSVLACQSCVFRLKSTAASMGMRLNVDLLPDFIKRAGFGDDPHKKALEIGRAHV
jgi:hypothetical protein